MWRVFVNEFGEVCKSQIRHGLLSHVYVGHRFYVPLQMSSWTVSCLFHLTHRCKLPDSSWASVWGQLVSCPSGFKSFSFVIVTQPYTSWVWGSFCHFCTWRKPRLGTWDLAPRKPVKRENDTILRAGKFWASGEDTEEPKQINTLSFSQPGDCHRTVFSCSSPCWSYGYSLTLGKANGLNGKLEGLGERSMVRYKGMDLCISS